MKKVFIMGLAIVLFTACNQKQRYTQNSPEIDTFKSVIKSYNDQDWEGMTSQYADTAKTFNNSSDVGLSLEEMVAYHKESLSNLSNRGFLDKDQEYEMVITDKGDTWVNFWGDWEGTLKANGKKIKIPIHLTGQFKDGKIVRTSGNWDNAPMVLALQEIEANNNFPPGDNRAIVNGMYQSFSTGDIPAVLASLDQKVIWMEAEGNSLADGNPYKGPDAVLNGIFNKIGENYESFTLEKIKLHEMVNDEVFATLRYNGKLKANGATIDAQAAHLWTLRNGKVIGFQQYVDTKQLAEAESK
ncbi:nuclear transport factor 2 family protein [Maribacter halichondriae]|uniref:nuclear transport factor 2 family protein n=1 Tax=Maribacter halichondriae TaxID=2980554 RepID=UPI0023580D82|nr:nuclear transport factor 2 family protein [Maribacter sp. Hal144]